MIVDSPANLGRYAVLNPRFAAAAKFLSSLDFSALTAGRMDIDGDDLFATVMTDRQLKQPDEAPLEVHDRYIDIQLLVHGVETFGWADRASCLRPRGSLDVSKDILFFDDMPTNHVSLQSGQSAVFFPWDAHAPLIGEGTVTKLIVKVKA